MTENHDLEDPTLEWSEIPSYRKLGTVVLILILIIPVGLLIIWSGPIYSRDTAGVRKASVAWKLSWTAIALAAMFFIYQWQLNEAISSATIPTCDASETLSIAKLAVENSPAGHVQGLRLLDFKSSEELRWNESDQTRICGVLAATTAGTLKAMLNISWLNRESAEIYVQIDFTPRNWDAFRQSKENLSTYDDFRPVIVDRPSF